ncbi:uncharacterized protein Z519_07070 [Cladophialophora bantiana CBS 173.52]|uniref:Uncharacterized protein n=1 Tax=Cladophialophora bantiana (strain ATCC 10958 / CBS 173.52 / CDC B-1940 / NIH 8579) TaxID=1442370 RepID=A0A0D2EQ72_CLAB1|nr:uncharacterized protein Z519_07070 [Cladophialophora bantiana CBS 173.52]KIW92086.1 hypothetical protein Z519_07070 [Cladophialophora bantiana CBS 173.52]
MGFSFNRFMTNAFPNFANDNPERDADLTTDEKDTLWTHQVTRAEAAQRWPMTLDAGSALKAGITPNDKISARIHKELVKNGVIDPCAPLGIDTTRITPKFAHQLAFISVAAQRKVVGMLFFWEEEAIRWRLLEQEQAEIETAMGVVEGGVTEETKKELQVRLESVRMRKAMKPSQRPPVHGASSQESLGLPQYS